MWLYSRCVPCVLLAILVPSASETISQKLEDLLSALRDVDLEVGGVLDITDDQCPCLENVTLNGNETFEDVECYETKIEIFRNNLNALITFVESIDANTSTTCPERTGSLFVAACDSPEISVVDPNGFIQNGFRLATNVTGWTLGPFDNDSFEFDYFGSEPFVLRCLSLPDGMEVVLGNSSDDPLTMTGEGAGIAYFEPTNEIFVAMNFDNSSFNGVYAFNRSSFPQIRFLFPYDGTTGRLFVSGDTLYMSDDLMILRIRIGETSWTEVVSSPLPPLAFAVQDDGLVVMCEESGSITTFDQATGSIEQLKLPTRNGDFCGDIALRPCDGNIYVAFQEEQHIEVYGGNTTELIQDLQYTLNNATMCPSLLLDPRTC